MRATTNASETPTNTSIALYYVKYITERNNIDQLLPNIYNQIAIAKAQSK